MFRNVKKRRGNKRKWKKKSEMNFFVVAPVSFVTKN